MWTMRHGAPGVGGILPLVWCPRGPVLRAGRPDAAVRVRGAHARARTAARAADRSGVESVTITIRMESAAGARTSARARMEFATGA